MTFGSKDISTFRDAFERACSHIPCGVAVLTGTDPQEGPFGMTVSSLAFVSAEPPLISVSIDRNSKRVDLIRRNRGFPVNLLGEDQGPLATLFATPRQTGSRTCAGTRREAARRFWKTPWELCSAKCAMNGRRAIIKS